MRLKRKTRVMICCMAICLGTSVQAQTKKALHVGDSVPDVVLEKIIHSEKKQQRISDFNDQLLILDFWGTSCILCIEAMPKMEQLQKAFGSRIKILPVTNEGEKEIMHFWSSNKFTKDIKLPSVVEDTKLYELFPHRSQPHEIWIYKGKVIAITGHEYVDAKNIQAVLNGEQVSLALKYDYYKFDFSKPIFAPDPARADSSVKMLGYTAVCGYITNAEARNGQSFDIVRDSANKTVRVYIMNKSIYIAYHLCYLKATSDKLNIPFGEVANKTNHIVWEVEDRSKYRYSENIGYNQDWRMKNAICFEALSADTGQSDQQVYLSVISNLNRLLGLSVRWEKRKEMVYVIKMLNGKEKYKKYEKPGLDATNLAHILNMDENHAYVYDETGAKGQGVYLDPELLNHLDQIKSQLAAYGLDYIQHERLVDKLIFSENKYFNNNKFTTTIKN